MKRFENILHGGLYRSRHGMLLGVCRGIAEYFDLSVFWVRTLTVIVFLFSGFWPIMGLYFLAAFLMKPEPVVRIETDDQQEFYDSYVSSRKGAVDRVKRRYDHLERRIQRMEDAVTTREFDWEHRLNSNG
ncbi:MAG: envelope stress response membrane protein PspC [Desulfatiglandaceae bacterium]